MGKVRIISYHNSNVDFKDGNDSTVATLSESAWYGLQQDAGLACISINPDHPMAVAEQIRSMYEVCRYLSTEGWNAGVSETANKLLSDMEVK